jgi:hypothetical protein
VVIVGVLGLQYSGDLRPRVFATLVQKVGNHAHQRSLVVVKLFSCVSYGNDGAGKECSYVFYSLLLAMLTTAKVLPGFSFALQVKHLKTADGSFPESAPCSPSYQNLYGICAGLGIALRKVISEVKGE